MEAQYETVTDAGYIKSQPANIKTVDLDDAIYAIEVYDAFDKIPAEKRVALGKKLIRVADIPDDISDEDLQAFVRVFRQIKA